MGRFFPTKPIEMQVHFGDLSVRAVGFTQNQFKMINLARRLCGKSSTQGAPVDIADRLRRRLSAYQYRRDRMVRQINILAIIRFVLGIFGIIGFSLGFDAATAYPGAVLFLVSVAAFIVAMIRHDRCNRSKERSEMALALLREDLARVEYRFQDISEEHGIPFEEDHPFAHDLDLRGTISLLKLVDNSFHDQAKKRLKHWIDHPGSPEEILTRQAAIEDLSLRQRFRMRLNLSTREHSARDLSADRMDEWLSEKTPMTLGLPMYLVGRVLSLLTSLVVVLHFFFAIDLPYLNWVMMLAINVVFFYVMDGMHRAFNMSFMQRGKAISAVCDAIKTFEQTPVKAAQLRNLKQTLLSQGGKAGKHLDRLIELNQLLEYRSNGFGHLFLNTFLMWDQHHLRQLAAWRDRHGDRLKAWIQIVFEIEALAAIANYKALYPNRSFPKLLEGNHIHIEAKNLGHPAIAANTRVGNDFSMTQDSQLHLVTGSNMSGKSTFLRTIGVNLVLARLGAPVCADSLSCTLPQLWTSIKIQDSLAQGVSYFYAEVRRIKRILDEIGNGDRVVFYLMDEILKGTNSRERLIASKAMVTYLVENRASGLITTHDLEMLDITRELPENVINFHFQEQVQGETMFFDYKLKRGQLTSTNALRVMKFAGVPLDFPSQK